MKQSIRRLVTVALSAAVVLAVGACTTTNHALHIAPIDSDVPVSASAYYVDAEGQVIGPDDYEITDYFEHEVRVEGQVAAENGDSVDITHAVEEAIAPTNAAAVVNFRTIGYQFDPGNTGMIGFTRIFGGGMLICGGLFLALSQGEEPLAPIGGGFAALGLGSMGYSFLFPGETAWTIRFEGEAVR
ncbi:MAG: hypothetical protein ACOC2Y_08025 [Spirochaetota bacterium]